MNEVERPVEPLHPFFLVFGFHREAFPGIIQSVSIGCFSILDFLAMLRILILGSLLFCAAGCVSCPPDWYFDKPADDNYRYAVGKSDPTYVETKAKELAMKSALSDLAWQKSVWVMSLGEYRSTDTGAAGAEKSAHYSEVDIEGAELVEEHWCDGSWGHQYPKGTYFVLVRIEKSRLLAR
jgi:hypothetical protein